MKDDDFSAFLEKAPIHDRAGIFEYPEMMRRTFPLARFSFERNRSNDEESRQLKFLKHVLNGKLLSTFPGHALVLVPFLASCGAGDETVFSSRASPDASLVAKSVMIGSGEAPRGRLVVRATDGTEWHVDLVDTAPDLFVRWIDNKHLEVWSERKKPDIGDKDKLGDVRIVLKSFEPVLEYRKTGLNTQNIVVPVGSVVANFTERIEGEVRLCILTIGTRPSPAYDTATLEMTASVVPSGNRARPRAGIDTRFNLSDDRQLIPQRMLTSATVSNIPSYNRLPNGSDGTSVHGSFLEQSAGLSSNT